MSPLHAIVELMGRTRFGALVTEAEVAGVKMLRCELCTPVPCVKLVHPQALFALTPCTEAQAKAACGEGLWALPFEMRPALPSGRPRTEVLDEAPSEDTRTPMGELEGSRDPHAPPPEAAMEAPAVCRGVGSSPCPRKATMATGQEAWNLDWMWADGEGWRCADCDKDIPF